MQRFALLPGAAPRTGRSRYTSWQCKHASAITLVEALTTSWFLVCAALDAAIPASACSWVNLIQSGRSTGTGLTFSQRRPGVSMGGADSASAMAASSTSVHGVEIPATLSTHDNP